MAAPASGLLRRLRQAGWLRGTLVRLGAGYIALVRRTVRWEIEGKAPFEQLAREGAPIIAVIWHGRLMMSPTWAPPGRRTVAMISNNSDGELIAGIVGRFGVEAVRGSTYDRAKRREKGGARAFALAHRAIREGAVLAITPDGPRGPRMRAQLGAAQLAITTGAPVVPIAFSARWGLLTRGWDRFLVPLPFSRGAEIFGPPILPPPGDADAATVERFRRQIEAALTEVTDRADARCGRAPVSPEPPGATTGTTGRPDAAA